MTLLISGYNIMVSVGVYTSRYLRSELGAPEVLNCFPVKSGNSVTILSGAKRSHVEKYLGNARLEAPL